MNLLRVILSKARDNVPPSYADCEEANAPEPPHKTYQEHWYCNYEEKCPINRCNYKKDLK